MFDKSEMRSHNLIWKINSSNILYTYMNKYEIGDFYYIIFYINIKITLKIDIQIMEKQQYFL